MNTKTIFINALGLCLALIMVMSFLSGGGNEIGGLLKFLSLGALLFTLYSPVFGFWTLILSIGYIDLLKRMLVLGNHINFDDVTALLAFPPILCVIIFISILGKDILRRQFTKFDKQLLVTCGFLLVIMSGYAISGAEGILGILKTLANALGYVFLVYIVPKLFTTSVDITKMVKSIVILFIPVAVYGVIQKEVGLADFEIQYLMTGFSLESRILNGQDFRFFSTLNSSQNLAKFGAMMSALVFMMPSKSEINQQKFFSIPVKIFLGILFFYAAFISGARTGLIMGIVAMMVFYIYQSKLLTIGSYTLGVIVAIIVVFSAESIVKEKKLNQLSEWLYKIKPESFEYSTNIATMTSRFIGFSHWKNPDFWRPFGYYFSDEDYELLFPTHDSFSSLILKFGYLPVMILSAGIACFLFKFHKNLFKFRHLGKEKFVFSGLVFCVVFGALSTDNFRTFPINVMFYLFMGCYITIIHNERQMIRSTKQLNQEG
jgi:hypothetical protein